MLYFESIAPRNVFSFGPETPALELRDLNILIGANGTGKSNLLKTLNFLCSKLQTQFVPKIMLESMLRDGCKLEDFEIEITIDGQPRVLGWSSEKGLNWSKTTYTFPSISSLFRNSQARQRPLNLARMLRVQDKLLAHLGQMPQLFESVLYALEPPKGTAKTRTWDLRFEKYMSEGLRWYVNCAAILLDPKPSPIIIIEDIDAGLHLDLVVQLSSLIVEASRRSQVFVSTYADEFLSALSEHYKSVVVFEMKNQTTEMHRLTKADVAGHLHDDQSLGKLWTMGLCGDASKLKDNEIK